MDLADSTEDADPELIEDVEPCTDVGLIDHGVTFDDCETLSVDKDTAVVVDWVGVAALFAIVCDVIALELAALPR